MSEPVEQSWETPSSEAGAAVSSGAGGESSGQESQLTRALMSELVKIRKKRKIGQEPIAKAIGITQGRVSQMENLRGGGLTLEAVLLYAQTIGADIVVVAEKGRKKGSN